MEHEEQIELRVLVELDLPPMPNEESVDVKLGKDGYRVSDIWVTVQEMKELLMLNKVDVLRLKEHGGVKYAHQNGVKVIRLGQLSSEPNSNCLLKQTYGGTWNCEIF